MKVQIIANPIAGGGRGIKMAAKMEEALRGRVEELDVFITQKAGDAREKAATTETDCFISVGGDGTANEVLNGMGESGSTARLALLPLGTANVVAKQLKIPKKADVIADWVVDGHEFVCDAGVCNGQRFMLGCGAGVDSFLVEAMHARRGKKSGLIKWVIPTITTVLTFKAPKVRVIADDELITESGEYVIIGNVRNSAAIFPITPLAKMDDGLIDVTVIKKFGVLRCLLLLAAVFRPGFEKRKDLIYRQVKKIRLESADGRHTPLQIDGDPGGELPADISIEHHAVRIVTKFGK